MNTRSSSIIKKTLAFSLIFLLFSFLYAVAGATEVGPAAPELLQQPESGEQQELSVQAELPEPESLDKQEQPTLPVLPEQQEQPVQAGQPVLPALVFSNDSVLMEGGLKIFTSGDFDQGAIKGEITLSFDICVFGKSATIMDVLFMVDSLYSKVDYAEIEIGEYQYDPDVASYEMAPILSGVYAATGYSAPGGNTLANKKAGYVVGATGLYHNLETGTYRISLVLRGEQIYALHAKTIYSLAVTGSGGNIQIVSNYLDIITLGSSLRLTPEETLGAYLEAYDESFYLETGIQEEERAAATIHYNRPVVLTVNGALVRTDSPPVIEQGRTLVPVRALVEALGYIVAWEPASREVEIYDPDTYDCVIKMEIDSDRGYVLKKPEGETIEIILDVPAKIINGRTMVPARFIAEALGCVVDWDEGAKTVRISTS